MSDIIDILYHIMINHIQSSISRYDSGRSNVYNNERKSSGYMGNYEEVYLYMYVCIHMYVYICMYTYMYIYMYVSIYMYCNYTFTKIGVTMFEYRYINMSMSMFIYIQ
jgi:hypothetical protein